jgi:NAD+ kinase
MSSAASSIAYPTIALAGKPGAAGIADSLAEIAAFLKGSGRQVVFEAQTVRQLKLKDCIAMTPEQIGGHANAMIVVGGDGTMLGIARQLAPYPVPLIGINQGRLGFMTDIPADRMMSLLADMLAGKVESEQRTLLEGEVLRNGKAIFHGLAFNDVVVSRGTGAGMVELKVEVDGQFMYIQRSDGLIVATPTGSTAYSLSAGGPILHPNLNGIALVPIAPHALSNRPIVLSDNSQIVVEVVNGRDISVNFDMQTFASLLPQDRVVVRRSKHTVTFLHPSGWNYYSTLREKLHWHEYPSVEGQLK